RGRNVGGRCLDYKTGHEGSRAWFVRSINRKGDSGDSRPPNAPQQDIPSGGGGLVLGDSGDTGDSQTAHLIREGGNGYAHAYIEGRGNRVSRVSRVSQTGSLPAGTPFTVISQSADLPTVLQAIDESEQVGLDLETTGLNPHRDRPRLLQLATDRG